MGRGRGKCKAGVQISKPEPPPFLQRLREEIVATEDVDRRERSEKKRKERTPRDESVKDGPTVVKVNDDDLTEEEYKRMKLELETQYKLDASQGDKNLPNEDLDMDAMIEMRKKNRSNNQISDDHKSSITKRQGNAPGSSKATRKTLSYDSSSEDDDDE